MLLSDRDIKAELDAGRIGLDPYDPTLIQPSSIDVRLDRFFRLFDNHKYPFIDPADVPFEYNGRAGIEPLIAELKQAWANGKVPSETFMANHAMFLLKLLSHNLLRRFVLKTGLPHLQTWRASWVRRVLLCIPGRLLRSGRCWSLRLPLASPLLRLTG